MVHDALPDAGLRITDARPHCRHHTTGLMASNHWLATATNTDSRAPTSGSTVRVQVTATHARGFNLKYHLTWPWRGVWKLPQFQPTIAEKYDTAHIFPL